MVEDDMHIDPLREHATAPHAWTHPGPVTKRSNAMPTAARFALSAGRAARSDQRHEHAWFLPADDDLDGALDHVVVCAHAGFDPAALRALVDLHRIWGHGGADLRLTLVGLGSPRGLGGLRRAAVRDDVAPQLGTARVWESSTPFVPPRRIKARALGYAAHQGLGQFVAVA